VPPVGVGAGRRHQNDGARDNEDRQELHGATPLATLQSNITLAEWKSSGREAPDHCGLMPAASTTLATRSLSRLSACA
jgi:hypothetical protein